MFEIRQGLIPATETDAVLRIVNMELLKGFTAEQAQTWRNDHHWFSSLGQDSRVSALAEYLPSAWRTGEMDPGAQIVLQFPTENPRAFEETFHEDTMPDWPAEKRWRRIVGIPLTAWYPFNGAVRFKESDNSVAIPVLIPGDVVMFTGDQLHGPSPNRTGTIRYGIYLRWL